jgi:hypothetical protein
LGNVSIPIGGKVMTASQTVAVTTWDARSP